MDNERTFRKPGSIEYQMNLILLSNEMLNDGSMSIKKTVKSSRNLSEAFIEINGVHYKINSS